MVTNDDDPRPQAGNLLALAQDQFHQAWVVAHLRGQPAGFFARLYAGQGHQPPFGLADDLLCDSDHVAVAQRQPGPVERGQQQPGHVVARLHVGDAGEGEER